LENAMTANEEPEDRPEYHLPSPDLSIFDVSDPMSPTAGSQQRAGTEGSGSADTVANPVAEPKTSPMPAQPWAARGHHGTMRFQDPSTTKPQEPSLAERRARKRAEEQEAERQRVAEQRANSRRRVMIGTGVTVGAVALVGAWYLLSPANVTASCVGADSADQNTVVGDQYCDASYVTSHGGHLSNGIAFIPIPGGGFRQYRYYYGGTLLGGRLSGGTFTAPSRATIRTGSGTTIQRGGFGFSGSGESGGSRSGGS